VSRHSIELKWRGRRDTTAVIGYDAPLRTYFVQGFLDDEDKHEFWFGCSPREYPTLASLIKRIDEEGASIISLSPAAIAQMSEQAGVQRVPDYRDGLLRMLTSR
jgi:hypothetical protein